MNRWTQNMSLLRLAAVVALLTIAGCKDDETPCLQCPPPDTTPSPTIENIWPNADKMTWTFDYTSEETLPNIPSRLYPTPDDIPAFSWDDVREVLASDTLSGSTDTTEATYTMRFDSLLTTGSGAVGQNLEVDIDVLTAGAAGVYRANHASAFYARLYAARPDLRDAVLDAYAGAGYDARQLTEPFGVVYSPLLIHGGAWEKTEDWIGTYGDVDQILAWKFLSSDLSVGSEFTHQLVPSLASDVFLHCRIERLTTWQSDIGQHKKSLDCLYIIDYGLWVETNNEGKILGYGRIFDCGRVVYSPTEGPVYMYERDFVEPGDPPTPGVRYTELEITGTN